MALRDIQKGINEKQVYDDQVIRFPAVFECLTRMNFTLRHLNVSCKAYDHFSHCLAQLQDRVDGKCSFRVEQLPSDFPQFLSYERIEQLVRTTFIIIFYVDNIIDSKLTYS